MPQRRPSEQQLDRRTGALISRHKQRARTAALKRQVADLTRQLASAQARMSSTLPAVAGLAATVGARLDTLLAICSALLVTHELHAITRLVVQQSEIKDFRKMMYDMQDALSNRHNMLLSLPWPADSISLLLTHTRIRRMCSSRKWNAHAPIVYLDRRQ